MNGWFFTKVSFAQIDGFFFIVHCCLWSAMLC
jgi:hypothetical protein